MNVCSKVRLLCGSFSGNHKILRHLRSNCWNPSVFSCASAFHEKAGECQACFSSFFSFFEDVFVLLFLPVSSCP